MPGDSKPVNPLQFLTEISRNRWVRFTVFGLFLLLLGGLIWRIADILKLLVYAWVLAYLFDPLVDRLEKLRLPRAAAVMVLIMALALVLVLSFVLLVPVISKNFDEFLRNTPEYGKTISMWLFPIVDKYLPIEVPATIDDLMKQFSLHQGAILEWARKIYEPAWQALAQTLTGLQGLVNAILSVIVVPVAWFYLLRDFDKLKAAILSAFPSRQQPVIVEYAREVDGVIASFMRGQLTVCLVLGIIYAVGLQFVSGTPLGFLIGIFAGFASIVPYLGLLIGIGPALILTLLEHGDILHPILVVVVFSVAQLLEGTVVTPKIVGDQLGMHPVTIIFAILVWGSLLGFVGMLIAVPLTAILSVFFRKIMANYRKSDFYRFGNLKSGG